MVRRRALSNFIESHSNAMLDFASLFFGADRASQGHHVIERLRDAAVGERIDSNAKFLHAISKDVLRAVRDHQVRLIFDDLFDIRIQQSAYPRFVSRSRWKLVVIADGDDSIG